MLINTSELEPTFWDKFGERWNKLMTEINRRRKERVKRYLMYTSMNCCHYLIDDNLNWISRFTWTIVHLTAMSLIGIMIWIATDIYKHHPTLTTRMPIDESISEIPFPGIAICSVNKMSLKKVTEFAKEIIANDMTDMAEDELVHLLGYIGLAYEFEETIDGELDTIHDILKPYNLESILRKLSPSCEDLLTQCMWRGNIEDCSTMFLFHKTSEGYCCTFNYIRNSDNFIKNENMTKQEPIAKSYVKSGLDVVLDPMLDDYLYTRMPSVGFKIMIFNPTDFPDVPSGGCIEHMVIPKSELFVILDAMLVTATDDVKNLPQARRGCYIHSDNRLFDSYSDCVVNCRIKSALNSCGCIPFLWPSNNMSGPCDLTENGCLKKWNRLWENAWSGEDQALESGEEADVFEKGPPCAHCVPACSDASYKTRRYFIPLNAEKLNNETMYQDALLFKKGVVYKDHSVLHIFFEKDSFIHLSHDIFLTWFDWIGLLGGLCGLIMGCSVLTVAEILYFLVFGGPLDEDCGNEETNLENEDTFEENENMEYKLYWNELGI